MSREVISNIKPNFFSQRKENKENLQVGVNTTYIALFGLIVFLLLYYVWILNANATKGYNIRILEEEKSNLLIEKELLDVKIAELESLSTIMQDDDIKEMEKIDNPDYLVIKENVKYVYNND